MPRPHAKRRYTGDMHRQWVGTDPVLSGAGKDVSGKGGGLIVRSLEVSLRCTGRWGYGVECVVQGQC